MPTSWAVCCEDYMMKSCGQNACHTQHTGALGTCWLLSSLSPPVPSWKTHQAGALLNAGGLLKGAALFLLQRSCLPETHYSFLFVHVPNNQSGDVTTDVIQV